VNAFRNSKRRLRHAVWLTLLTWSFALASGVVNACVLSLPERAAEGSTPALHIEAGAHTGSSAGIGGHADDDHGGSSGKETCLKFCDDESSALAKSTTYGADLLAALVDVRVERHLAVPAVMVHASPLPEPPHAQGPPLVIRFLRLTL
jgi:hypothetical protein